MDRLAVCALIVGAQQVGLAFVAQDSGAAGLAVGQKAEVAGGFDPVILGAGDHRGGLGGIDTGGNRIIKITSL